MAKRRRRKGFRIPGVSFSMKRALGITSAKRSFARMTGIPTTKAGRKRKLQRMMGCGGCLLPVLAACVGMVLLIVLL